MGGLLRFSLFFVGVCLVLSSVLLAYPGGPAYTQTFEHETTLAELPANATGVAFYRHLTIDEQGYIERALDGERITLPAYRDLPPELVYHRSRGDIYRFEKTRYYDVGRTAGLAGVVAFVLGVAATGGAIRMDRRR